MTARKSAAPFYAAAVVWVAYALALPLYRGVHFAIVTAASVAVFAIAAALCRSGAKTEAAPKQEKKPEQEKTTGNPELDKLLKDGRLAVSEMKRLDENIADADISADIVRLEQVSAKIFETVAQNPGKLPQIRKFMDYYLPTTLKLLNAYDRAANAGVTGDNINATIRKVEGMMRSVVAAFEKQLDALFGDEALDISTDITVLESMMVREGLVEDPMKFQTNPPADPDSTLQL